MLFQAFPGIISHMLVLVTPSLTVHNTKYLDPYHWSHISFRWLFLRQWCRDVASGTDKHLDITFRLHLVESSSLVSVLFREAFNHPYISFFLFTSKRFFCYLFPYFSWTPYLLLIGRRYISVGGEELKWHQLAHHQLMSQQGPHFSPHSKAKAIYKSTNLRN